MQMEKTIENGNIVCLKQSVVEEHNLTTNVGVISMSEAQEAQSTMELDERKFDVKLENGTLVEVEYTKLIKLHGKVAVQVDNTNFEGEADADTPEPTIVDTFIAKLKDTPLEEVLKDVVEKHGQAKVDVEKLSQELINSIHIDEHNILENVGVDYAGVGYGGQILELSFHLDGGTDGIKDDIEIGIQQVLKKFFPDSSL